VKRSLALLTAAAVVATPLVGHAAPKAKPKPKPTTRTVTWDYTAVHGATTPVVFTTGESPCTVNADGCFELFTEKHETAVSMKVVDASGQAVPVQYHFNGEYVAGAVFTSCGDGSFKVKKGTQVTLATVVDPTCAGLPTQGTVTFTITGLK
jgi:hypothetical protein